MNFPAVQLCYEMVTHKKVADSHVALVIPAGSKALAWFQGENNCVVMKVEGNHQEMEKVEVAFKEGLIGSVFYGTVFSTKEEKSSSGSSRNPMFCVEDLYYYLGTPFRGTFLDKLEKLKKIFRDDLSQRPNSHHGMVFGLPVMFHPLASWNDCLSSLPYAVQEIKFRYFDKVSAKKIVTMSCSKAEEKRPPLQEKRPPVMEQHSRQERRERVFKVMADAEPDIYHLFQMRNGVEEYYDMAGVPNYSTSVKLNRWFRNIRENERLDAIEESDDETDFEDPRPNKYVHLERVLYIRCEYHPKSKRWVPLNLV